MTRDCVLISVFLKIQSLIGWIQQIICVLDCVLWDILLIIHQSHVNNLALLEHMLIIQQEDVFLAALLLLLYLLPSTI